MEGSNQVSQYILLQLMNTITRSPKPDNFTLIGPLFWKEINHIGQYQTLRKVRELVTLSNFVILALQMNYNM